jgi:hypothetical protein
MTHTFLGSDPTYRSVFMYVLLHTLKFHTHTVYQTMNKTLNVNCTDILSTNYSLHNHIIVPFIFTSSGTSCVNAFILNKLTLVTAIKLHASRPRKNFTPHPHPYREDLSHKYCAVSFATLRVLSCLHSSTLCCSCYNVV